MLPFATASLKRTGRWEVAYAVDDKCITLRTDNHKYKLDVRKVDLIELSAMSRLFRKMNFDSSIKLSGV